MKAATKALVSLLVGAISAPYLILAWAQVAGHGLIFDPLYSSGLRGDPLRVTVAIADFLATFVMLLPAAIVLRSLGLPRLAFHTALAALALFLASSFIGGLPLWPTSWQVLVANLSPYVALCSGVWLLSNFGSHTPNNSFKPTPLRGAA